MLSYLYICPPNLYYNSLYFLHLILNLYQYIINIYSKAMRIV